MRKSEINPMPEYFDRYINLCADKDLHELFTDSINQLKTIDYSLLTHLKNKRYLPGKWTVNDILQHITDIERLLCAGTLRFARNESSFVISFNENEMVKNSTANDRTIEALMNELISVRHSTISLYQSFDKSDLLKTGINWKHRISVLAMGFNIVGHQLHHLNIIKERYYPLVNELADH